MTGSDMSTVDDVRTGFAMIGSAVDAVLPTLPPTKGWVRAAVSRQGASRCPVALRKFSYDLVARQGRLLAELLTSYPDDVVVTKAYEFSVGYQPPGTPNPIDPMVVLTESATWTDEWGTEWEHARGGVGASPMGHPLANWDDLDQYLASRIPDARAAGRLDGARSSVELHAPTRYFLGQTHMALFERMHFLRGMASTFEDLYFEPARVEQLLDALTDYYLGIIRGWKEMGPVDGIALTDDWGSQGAMMIAPSMWRRYWAPRYRKLFDEAHRLGLQVLFHTCGNIFDIIPDLIDVGVDILDPIQPEALDITQVAREFGGKIAFSGGLSDQLLEVFTPQQVRDHVRRTIDTLGAPFGNAYLIGPSNVVMPDVPPENLVALFEAAHDQ